MYSPKEDRAWTEKQNKKPHWYFKQQNPQCIHQMKTEHEYNKETTTTKTYTLYFKQQNPNCWWCCVCCIVLLTLCLIILRARHDRNKIAPCGMIKVFWIELNWIECKYPKKTEHDYKKNPTMIFQTTTKSKVFTIRRRSMDRKSNNTVTFQQRWCLSQGKWLIPMQKLNTKTDKRRRKQTKRRQTVTAEVTI